MTFEYMLKERERRGIEQGREQGRSEGLAEGAAQEKREIAKNLKHLGLDFEQICQATGLTAEEIAHL